MYVVERWLARLAISPYVDQFVLKGGMLMAAMGARRPTIDVDGLARNIASDERTVARWVAAIASIADPDDGVEFLADTISTSVIRDDAAYSGVRVSMKAHISTAMVKLKLDINFGDPVIPEPGLVEVPTLRPHGGSVRVLGYPIETVVAEKISTAIQLGAGSTRVRDWADIYTLTGSHRIEYATTHEALWTTAKFRTVAVQPLSSAIGMLVDLRSAAYTIYRTRLGAAGEHLPILFSETVDAVVEFADPLTDTDFSASHWDPATRRWRTRE